MTRLDNAKVKELYHRVIKGPCFSMLVYSYIGSVLVIAAFAGGYLSLFTAILALTLIMIMLQLSSVCRKLKHTEALLKTCHKYHTGYPAPPEGRSHVS
jgi:hypothetical protein